ncbi:hypothetical protein [Nonomuraea insulae]|uniref:Uncharacterized protein n=1 Tax=Nonomuraea insulae TaxID=1616787 RepID=A0ABW1CSZ5_9ACTN
MAEADWESHRRAVFGAAYRILGTVAEAEAAGPGGKEVKKWINRRIHPPVDDASKILAATDRVYLEIPFFPGDE